MQRLYLKPETVKTLIPKGSGVATLASKELNIINNLISQKRMSHALQIKIPENILVIIFLYSVSR